MDYKELSDEQVIELSIDYVKHNHEVPNELLLRLDTLGLKDVILAPLEIMND